MISVATYNCQKSKNILSVSYLPLRVLKFLLGQFLHIFVWSGKSQVLKSLIII